MLVMTRQNSKCRKWEKQRRVRLSEAFAALSKVLPGYDPCVNICKIDILTTAKSTIKEQQDELIKISSAKGDNNRNPKNSDIFKKLEERIKKLIKRNEQLRDLLTTAGVSIPKYVGSISVKTNLFKKVSPEQAEIFQKKEMEKENKLVQIKTNKLKTTTAPDTLKRARTVTKSPNKLPCKRRKITTQSTAPPCLLLLPQPLITAGVNNSCFLLSNQYIGPTKSIPSVSGITSNFPLINPQYSSLAPGTLVLTNGSMLPFVPKQQVLVKNQQKINIKCMAENSATISKTSSQTIKNKCGESITQADKIRPIKPKCCVTNTTQINRVPIPAFTSRYANNQSLLSKECSNVENARSLPQKSKGISKDKKTKVIKKKLKTSVEDNIRKKKDDRIENELEKGGDLNESEKTTLIEDSLSTKSGTVNTSQSTTTDNSTSEMSRINVSSPVSISTPSDENQKTCDSVCAEENDQILVNNKEPTTKKQCNNGIVKEETDKEVTKEAAPENIDISHAGDDLTCLASSAACDENMKTIGLNLDHSELSNDDIFASLHVPPGCQNPESTSPTAAFLMAFPLVSSVKATDGMDDDHSSQQQSPTLIQIGTMDSTKHTHTDTLAGSLLGLESFSFFNSKDECENYYESCTNIPPKDSENTSPDVKNKEECVNSSAATSETTSLESVLSNCDPPEKDPKPSQNINYTVFHNSTDNHEANVHEFDVSKKASYGIYPGVKCSISNTDENNQTECVVVNKTTTIAESVPCVEYQKLPKDPARTDGNVENVLVVSEDTVKKTEVHSQPIITITTTKNNYEKTANPKNICYEGGKIKESQEYVTCQEDELRDISDVSITFQQPNSDREILKTNSYNMFQGRSSQTVTVSNEKMNPSTGGMLCDYSQQIQNRIAASTTDINVHETLMYDTKAKSSEDLVKKSNSNYEIHQNVVAQEAIMYKSFQNNIQGSVGTKKTTEDITNATPYIYSSAELKSSNIHCNPRNSVNIHPAICSVDNMPFNNFQMKPIQRTEIASSEKAPNNNKTTENIAFNIFETTHQSRVMGGSGSTDNLNTDGKLPHSVQQNYKKDTSQKSAADKSQCYFTTMYPDSSYNLSYKSNSYKLCPTCAHMNLNKSYSNPLYTNSNNYNYHPDNNASQNYYKTSTPKTDTKSYYSLNYENYQEYKKSEGQNYPKCYGNSLVVHRDRNIVDKTNANKEKCVPQNKLVNWMTTPENKVQPSDACSTFPNQPYSLSSCVTGEANDISNILEPKKHLDISLMTEDKQFTWSQSKLPNFLDQTHNFFTPTLPTLVGDLALGNPIPFNDQYKYPKDQKRKNNVYENQTNFLSVSQLVDHDKTENVPSRITSRRSSGGRSKNIVQMKNKRLVKNENNDKVGQMKPNNNFNNVNSSGNHAKNTSSSYSAEALIGHQIVDTSKKYSSNPSKPVGSTSFLTENIITYFPTIEDNYMNQNQNFQNSIYTHNTFQNTNHSSISTNSFIYTTPTITSSYLTGNFDAPCYEYSENLNVLTGPAVRDKVTNIKNYKPTTNNKDEKNLSNTNSIAKKPKKKFGNEIINSGFSNFEFPLLPMPGSTNSPILPDDFHTHSSFLPPTAPYPAKTSMYQKQGNDFTSNGLLPLPGLPRNTTQHPDMSPSLNSVGTSLTNFNLSTIFPEINKGNVSNVYQDSRNKEHSSFLQMPFNLEPKYSFPG